MADIFISYAREDQPLATRLADHLEQAGWAVWWDRDIPIGKDYDLIIDAQLETAKCVIVLWTKDSIVSRNVKDEANEALNREKLLPIQVGPIRPPMGFRMIQSMVWQEASVIDHHLSDLLELLKTTIGIPLLSPRKKLVRKTPVPIETPPVKKKPVARKPAPKPVKHGIDEQKLVEILKSYSRIKNLFFAPNIPATKEKNARAKCMVPDDEKVLALLDLTVFGAADDCLIFTPERIFHHNIASEAVLSPYTRFPQIFFSVKTDSFFVKKIELNDDVLDMVGMNSPLSDVVDLFNEIKRNVHVG